MLVQAPKASTPVSLNWIGLILLVEKRQIDKFYESDDESEKVQVPENKNSSYKEIDWEVSDFLVKILHINGCLKNYEGVFYEGVPSIKGCSTKICVLQKLVLEYSFSALMIKSLKKCVWMSSLLVKLQAYSQQMQNSYLVEHL